jgi:hypothetical protein
VTICKIIHQGISVINIQFSGLYALIKRIIGKT